MKSVEFHGWSFTCDELATATAYDSVRQMGRAICECLHCRNFRAARHLVYPPEALDLFAALAIDPTQEVEVYHNAPLDSGLHSYGGWFHFVGAIVHDTGAWVRLSPVFGLWFRTGSSLAPSPFKGMPLVQCEIDAEVPWVLLESYAG